VLGIYQPPEDESRVHLTFLEDTGPVNWYRDSATGPLDTFVIDAQTLRTRNMLPLVTVAFKPDGELRKDILYVSKSYIFSFRANIIHCKNTIVVFGDPHNHGIHPLHVSHWYRTHCYKHVMG